MATTRKTTKAAAAGPAAASRRSAKARPAADQAAAKKAAAKKATAKQAPAKQAPAKQATAKQATAKQATAKQATAKQATAKQATAKQATAKQATAKKAAPKKAAPKKAVPKKAAPNPPIAKATTKKAPFEPDFTHFPPETVREQSRHLCLACVLDVFTRHLGLAAATAQKEIRKYRPGLAELTSPEASRPYYDTPGNEGHCPHCEAPARWQARLIVHRIEGGKATDAARRQLVKVLPVAHDEFEFLDEKATGRDAFFQWLEHVGAELDFDSDGWPLVAARLYLARKEPKVDWEEMFRGVGMIRRSRQMESGWEREGYRLFLAPLLFDEILLIQYLVSRSQKSGGLTFEGRKTLQEMVARLRHSGYLRAVGAGAYDPGDVLEQLLDYLSGGDAAVKFHYILDRREFLDRLAALKQSRVPKPKL